MKRVRYPDISSQIQRYRMETKMKIKEILRKFAFVAATFLMAICCVTVGGIKIASAEEANGASGNATSNIVELFKPTATGENYTATGFNPWINETKVIDYAASPTGKVDRKSVV